MTAETLAAAGTGPGRPRDPHVEAAIVQATLELLRRAGLRPARRWRRLPPRAGVGKATIYRRWPGKEQLVVHAVATVTEIRTSAAVARPAA